MPDITALILEEHERFRRRFAELDELRARSADAQTLTGAWKPLADLLERHAAAEEDTFYPRLLDRGDNAEDETEDAITDHNDIRAAVARAEKEQAGSDAWWAAVLDAREENSKHVAEEERGALPDARENMPPEVREELGAAWLRFCEEHAGARGLDLDPVDPDAYLDANG